MERRLSDFLSDAVRASNAIEGIFAEPGSPLFDNHLEAIEYSRRAGKFVSPHKIHKVLMRGIMPDAGQSRVDDAGMVDAVTGKIMNSLPRPQYIKGLLQDYLELIDQLLLCYCEDGFKDEAALEEALFHMHAHGLCIHPFTDGNGRTFRIFWNQIRQFCGLGWLVVVPPPVGGGLDLPIKSGVSDSTTVFDYAGKIRRYEDEVFRPRYSYVY